MSTRGDRFLTTGGDIEKLLTRCKKCYSITNNGKYVIFHTELPNLIIPNRKKVALIVNTTRQNQIGHWFLLIIFKNSRNSQLFLCDGLGRVEKEPRVMKNIELFCKNNNLIFHNYNLKIQTSKSLACGYLILFFLFKFSILSLNGFLSLKRIMIRQSVRTNEKIALKSAKQHFRILSLWFK